MPTSKKIQATIEKSSFIRKMFEEGARRKAQYGPENVSDFSLGNPNLEPPAKLKDILKGLIEDPSPSKHAYMPNAGFPETRKAVAEFLNSYNEATFSGDDIVMTVGAGGGLNVVFKTILDPGSEVIIPTPYFVEYDFYLDNHQGLVRRVPSKKDFSFDLDAMEQAISEKTKAVLINSPNNPTGKVYSKKDIDKLAEVLTHHSRKQGSPIYLISDEPYRKIVYDGVEVPSIFDAYPESFLVTSFSKDLSLPGERIGYAATHPDMSDKGTILAGMILCNRILGYVNAPAIMQRAIAELLYDSVDISPYKKNRDILCDALGSFGYEFQKPEGAFYLFPKSPIPDDVAFIGALRDENILTVPGSGFMGPGHFRIAYCVNESSITRSLPGFEKTIKNIKG
ncbi:MAG: pyridoxal phosphate-dependent aminotransferase [Deltaproteobacteria bacterium]|nr:pyridoxal phosphate-dependent aminotransferase [Deltaproteobacteria bacterium]